MAAFDPSFLDELRARLGIAGVVGRRVKLIKRGREYTGLCPFHNEKTPSFTVSDDKGFFHCFGCGAHGDVIGFVMRTENLSFPEAVEKLAGEAGLQLPNLSPAAREEGRRRQTLQAVIEAAALWFAAELAGPRGRGARDYLERRGLAAEAIARFRLGYAPEARGALKAALVKQGFGESLILEAGLIRKRDGERDTYDLFRNRVIFPISDRRGQPIAFGGRVLDPAPEGAPKYLNSPETALFHKGRVLYGFAQAREAARKDNLLVVTEGYMDAIAALAAGVPAVAPLGTALTEEQIAELWRLVPEPVLCFDGDAAGMRAAARAAERALPLIAPGRGLKFVTLPAGEDPDSLIRGQGVDAFRALLAQARPLSQMLWELAAGSLLQSRETATPERIAAAEKTLMDFAAKVADPTIRRHYQDYFRDRLRQDLRPGGRPAAAPAWSGPGRRQPAWTPPRAGFARSGFATSGFASSGSTRAGFGAGRPAGLPPPLPSAPPDPLGRGEQGQAARRERLLVVTVLNHPGLLAEAAEEFAHIHLESRDLDRLRRAIIELAADALATAADGAARLDAASLRDHLTKRGFSPVLERLDDVQADLVERFARPEAEAADALQGWRYVLERHRLAELRAEIKAAEAAWASDPENQEKWARLQSLKSEEHRGSSDEADMERHG